MAAEAEEPAFDFSHLPTDALHVVFEHVFAPADPQQQPALPLSLFWERWAACSAVCKTWREVLRAHPPHSYLAVSALPSAWLPWVWSLPLRALCIQAGLDARWWAADGAQGQQQQQGTAGPPPGMPDPIGAFQLVAGVEGAGGVHRLWSLAALPHLRHLHLQAPVSQPDLPAAFDSAVLQPLQQLAVLSLGSFSGFDLSQLPPSLRRLRLAYDGQTRVLPVPQLPEHVSLEVLRLEKPGALGICMDNVWAQVAELEVHAQELLIGVPVEDPRLIATFERPYREGNFVPPHIWGDEEADDNSKQAADMAANHLLATLPSCPRLQRVRVVGAAAASLKFMPAAPHAAASLQWLWSVVRLQGLHNLLGLSAHEMEARQQLFDNRLRFTLGPAAASGAAAAASWGLAPAPPAAAEPACCIEIVRDELAP
ncbi:TMV resistance N [Chlorella sorokiniana]|uniref:TMV resistance N n=1 Tax=Chlorella sorokiniana TaxID=3076 RepID=A0A2P6TH08_CHLSO|nr:TMV resistance N [Chlorella sorokiniana]|eukprot:PRW33578.1 TMV resistance N [Chlorella sorokiniana]